MAAAAGEGCVDAAEDFGCVGQRTGLVVAIVFFLRECGDCLTGSLDLTAVHGEHEARRPVHEALPDGVADCLYDFTRQPA